MINVKMINSIWMLEQIVHIVATFIPVLVTVAFYTLIERRVIAAIQRRKGPNVVGFEGVLQPIADGLKLFLKEFIIPRKSNFVYFFISPIYTFVFHLIVWFLLNDNLEFQRYFGFEFGILIFFIISAMSIYGIIVAAWSSYSRYSFLGGIRSAAQMIAYEITLVIVFLTLLIFIGSTNFNDFFNSQKTVWFVLPFFPLAFIFFICILAETNRSPFDLPEAESELVSGYNTEYSSLPFAFFFLGEYSNMLIMSIIFVILFLGGDSIPLIGQFIDSYVRFSWIFFKSIFKYALFYINFWSIFLINILYTILCFFYLDNLFYFIVNMLKIIWEIRLLPDDVKLLFFSICLIICYICLFFSYMLKKKAKKYYNFLIIFHKIIIFFVFFFIFCIIAMILIFDPFDSTLTYINSKETLEKFINISDNYILYECPYYKYAINANNLSNSYNYLQKFTLFHYLYTKGAVIYVHHKLLICNACNVIRFAAVLMTFGVIFYFLSILIIFHFFVGFKNLKKFVFEKPQDIIKKNNDVFILGFYSMFLRYFERQCKYVFGNEYDVNNLHKYIFKEPIEAHLKLFNYYAVLLVLLISIPFWISKFDVLFWTDAQCFFIFIEKHSLWMFFIKLLELLFKANATLYWKYSLLDIEFYTYIYKSINLSLEKINWLVYIHSLYLFSKIHFLLMYILHILYSYDDLFLLFSTRFWFVFKCLLIFILFIVPRVSYPRYRYDQLIKLGWKTLLPLSFSFFIFFLGIFKYLNIFPV